MIFILSCYSIPYPPASLRAERRGEEWGIWVKTEVKQHLEYPLISVAFHTSEYIGYTLSVVTWLHCTILSNEYIGIDN